MALQHRPRQEAIDRIYEELNNVFTKMQSISVIDAQSCDARQKGITSLITAMKSLDALGIRHSVKYGG